MHEKPKSNLRQFQGTDRYSTHGRAFDLEQAKATARKLVESVGLTPDRIREIRAKVEAPAR